MSHIDGRSVDVASLLMREAPRYRKTALVHAIPLSDTASIETPEGVMVGQPGDYLVSDDPPTHLWPVRREVFERTYASEDARIAEPAHCPDCRHVWQWHGQNGCEAPMQEGRCPCTETNS